MRESTSALRDTPSPRSTDFDRPLSAPPADSPLLSRVSFYSTKGSLPCRTRVFELPPLALAGTASLPTPSLVNCLWQRLHILCHLSVTNTLPHFRQALGFSSDRASVFTIFSSQAPFVHQCALNSSLLEIHYYTITLFQVKRTNKLCQQMVFR